MKPANPVFYNALKSTLIFGRAELKRNRISFCLPLPVYALMLLYFSLAHSQELGLYGTWSLLVLAALSAMIYGLQCFSNEADKKTLDFIITRPLSPFVIISAKYFLSLAILAGWLFIFGASARLSWHRLPLPEGMGPDWIVLILFIIHSISFFSGLLTRGLERFFAATAMTGILTGVSYQIWLAIFLLVKANYFWFDIPPAQLSLLSNVLPVYLALLSLATPFVGTVWYLRSRIPLHLFGPAKWLSGLWLATGLLVGLAYTWLAPPLWPDLTAIYGDWHPTRGILLSGPDSSALSDKTSRQSLPCQISLAQPGRKAGLIYRGRNIQNPRFAPDGKRIVFAEDGLIKTFTLQNRSICVIGPGHTASWSSDGSKLLYAAYLPGSRASRFFLADLKTGRRSQASATPVKLSGFVWNSRNNTVYYLGYTNEVGALNLTSQKLREYHPSSEQEKPLNYYSIIRPMMIYHPETHQVIWGQVFEDELRIFGLSIRNGQIELLEHVVHPRMKNACPVIIQPGFQSFLWQRTDGSFVSQATRFIIHKDNHHADEPGHEHDVPEYGHPH